MYNFNSSILIPPDHIHSEYSLLEGMKKLNLNVYDNTSFIAEKILGEKISNILSENFNSDVVVDAWGNVMAEMKRSKIEYSVPLLLPESCTNTLMLTIGRRNPFSLHVWSVFRVAG